MITFNFDPHVHSYDKETKTFMVSERDVQFATEYTIVNPKTGGSMHFKFTHSTGPEFEVDTQFIYESSDGITLKLCNNAEMVKRAAASYFIHHLNT